MLCIKIVCHNKRNTTAHAGQVSIISRRYRIA